MNTQELCIAICLIPHVEFDERTAHELIEAIRGRIEASNFKHQEHAINAAEYLTDAATVMENAADYIRNEQFHRERLEDEISRRYA